MTLPDPQCLYHYFPLRPSVTVKLLLPRDLTLEEAQRIGRWLGILVMEQSPRADRAGKRKP